VKSDEGKYNIKAISNMLGIQPGTLRAWERRYNIVVPIRNQAGHRLYTDEHVALIRWLIEKVSKGFTIGQAVGLIEKGSYSVDETDSDSTDIVAKLGDQILQALLNFKEHKAHELLNYTFSLFNVEKVTIDIIGPILVRVGRMWEDKEITIAHEHYVTFFLRSKIANIFHSLPVDGILPKAIAVCGPNERHELGLLIFTLFLRRKGFEVIYLGVGMPEADIEIVIKEINAKFLFTSCTLSDNLPEVFSFAERLDRELDNLIVGVGGFALMNLTEIELQKYNKFLVGCTKSEWEKWLSSHLYR
jgi:methanogenic corrinoid protein MtbC1